MRKNNIILLLIAFAIALVSCERKDLLEPGHKHGNRIPFHILLDMDKNVAEGEGVYFDSLFYSNLLATARTYKVTAYPLDLDVPVETFTLDSLSGEIWLLPGKYHILAHTSDFYEYDGLLYNNMNDVFKAEARTTNRKETTKDKNSRVKSYDISDPDPLFSKLMKDVEIRKRRDTVLYTTMEPHAYRYWYEVEVDGLDYITGAYLKIDGMYTTVYLADGSHNQDEYASHTVESQILKEENKIKGEFFSFGPHQSGDIKNSMVLTFVNGRTIQITLDDISPEIKRLKKGGEIKISQKIVINVGDDGSGFAPEVKDWGENIEIEIPI